MIEARQPLLIFLVQYHRTFGPLHFQYLLNRSFPNIITGFPYRVVVDIKSVVNIDKINFIVRYMNVNIKLSTYMTIVY